MKLFILWDMEGVSGLFTREHVWHWEDGVRPHIAEKAAQKANIQRINDITLQGRVDWSFYSGKHYSRQYVFLPKLAKFQKGMIPHRIRFFLKTVPILVHFVYEPNQTPGSLTIALRRLRTLEEIL